MAKTLIDCVNETLKRVGMVQGDNALLTTLTDSPRQRSIDIAVQIVNELNDELYDTAELTFPSEQSEDTITLVEGSRSYSLNDALTILLWPFIDKTNNQYLTRYPGGYNQMLIDDPEQDDTGLPHWGAISPVNGALHLDRTPTAVEAGRIYTYQYERDLVMTAAGDLVPYADNVFRAMVPAWGEIWRRAQQKEFDEALYRTSLGRAARLLRKQQPRTHYSPRA